MAFYKWLLEGDVDPYTKQVWTTDWITNPELHKRGALSVTKSPDIMKFIPYDAMPGRLWKVDVEGNSRIWDRFAHWESVRLSEFYGTLDCDRNEFALSMAASYIDVVGRMGVNTRRARIMLGHMHLLKDDPMYHHPDLDISTSQFLTLTCSSMRHDNPVRGWGDLGLAFINLPDHEISFELVKGMRPWLKA